MSRVGLLRPAQGFYDHIDKCEHCKSRPWDLCKEGQAWLEAGSKAMAELVCPIPPVKPARGSA